MRVKSFSNVLYKRKKLNCIIKIKKMLLYIDEYQLVQYDKEQSLFTMSWKKPSSRLNYKNVGYRFKSAANMLNVYNPKLVLIDFEQMVYKRILGNEDQFYNNIHSIMKDNGVEKFAYIKSNDKITQVLFDQLISNSELSKVELKSFNTAKEAKEWLLADTKIKEMQSKYAISA